MLSIRPSKCEELDEDVDVNQARVMRIMAELGGQARVREIVEALYRAGLYEKGTIVGGNVSKRLKQLAKWGMVVKVKHGLYRLSDG